MIYTNAQLCESTFVHLLVLTSFFLSTKILDSFAWRPDFDTSKYKKPL